MTQIQVHQWGIKQQTVQQVEDAADAGKEPSRVLHASLALEQRFNQIPHHGGGTQDYPKDDRMNPIHACELLAREQIENNARSGGDGQSAGKSLPGLAGTDAGDHFVFADEGADGVGATVAELGDEDEIKHVERAVHIREKVYFLNEVQQPGDVHQPEK